ncbi:MAG: hypothetical protein ACXWLH_04425 [Candidatus Saccharimonadales bacterium]
MVTPFQEIQAGMAWRNDAKDFLDPSQDLSADDQLLMMTEFKAEFGQNVPQLNQAQLGRVAVALEQHPGWRVLPTRLVDADARQNEVVPHTGSIDRMIGEVAKLWTPPSGVGSYNLNGSAVWAKLWDGANIITTSDDIFISIADKEKGMRPATRPFGLRYKDSDGSMLRRKSFTEGLVSKGQAIEGGDGEVWTFPVMKVADLTPDPAYKQPGELFKNLNYIISPEARLGVQVLNMLAGTPMHPDIVEITNETVSQLKLNNNHEDIKGHVGITRSSDLKFFRLSWWSGVSLPDWQLPLGVNGLDAQQ